MSKQREIVKDILAKNGVIIIPTDTIYGVVASAMSKKAVGRTYEICRRNPKKPFIILIESMRDLALFKVKIDAKTQEILKKIWPGKVSVVLPAASGKFQYLHRGKKTLAFRVPKKPNLAKILKYSGPLISTSANPEGKKLAETITQAKRYFGDQIDFYVSNGKMKSLPSTLIEIKGGKIRVIRQGAKKYKTNSLIRE